MQLSPTLVRRPPGATVRLRRVFAHRLCLCRLVGFFIPSVHSAKVGA